MLLPSSIKQANRYPVMGPVSQLIGPVTWALMLVFLGIFLMGTWRPGDQVFDVRPVLVAVTVTNIFWIGLTALNLGYLLLLVRPISWMVVVVHAMAVVLLVVVQIGVAQAHHAL